MMTSNEKVRGSWIFSSMTTKTMLEVACRFLQGDTFKEADAERRFLLYLSETYMLVDAGILLAGGVLMLLQSHLSRTSECAKLATSPCPLGFWALRAAGGVWNTCAGLGLMIARRRPRALVRLLPRYQHVLFTLIAVTFYLEIGQACLKELNTRPEKRCYNSVTMCPSFNWYWIELMARSAMLYFVLRCFSLSLKLSVRLCGLVLTGLMVLAVPWYTARDDDGRTYTVNNFQPGGVIMGFVYTLLVSFLALHCKAVQERLSRRMFEKRLYLLSQQASISALLQKYIPSRFSQAGGTELVMEEFPMVTILFCSFDNKSLIKYTQQQDAQTFLSTMASAVLDFDLLLEATDLFKLENVGQDYIVTSSVVTFGLSSDHPDTEDQRRADAVALVRMAQEMLQITNENRRACAVDGGGALDIKVGVHSGACVGALAGAQRRFYRLFGDTVNTAARMCSHSEMGTVHLSAATNDLVVDAKVNAVHRGAIHIKGKGLMDTYKVLPEKSASGGFAYGSRIPIPEAHGDMPASLGLTQSSSPLMVGNEQQPRSAGTEPLSQVNDFARADPAMRAASEGARGGHTDGVVLNGADLTQGGPFAGPLCASTEESESGGGGGGSRTARNDDNSLAGTSPSLLLASAQLAPTDADVDTQDLCSGVTLESDDMSSLAPTGSEVSMSCDAPSTSTRRHRASRRGQGKKRKSSLLGATMESLFRRQFIQSRSFRSILGSEAVEADLLKQLKERGQFRIFAGEFKDAVKEAEYQEASGESMKLEYTLLIRMLIVSTVYMHAYIYVIMNTNQRFNMNHTWIWVIGAFTACVQSTALWLMESPSLHSISHHALFYAMYVTSVTMLVPLVLVTPARFPMMGYLLLNLHIPMASRSSATAACVVFAGLLIVAIPILFLDGHVEGMSEILAGLFPIVAVLVLTPAVCRAYFINSRLVWQADNELKTQRQKLAGMLYDLVPSVAACRFVLQQHQNMPHLDERSLISRSTLLWAAPIGNVACVLTSDMVSFTVLSDKLGAMRVAQLLHDLWSIMDGVLNFEQAKDRHDDLALLEGIFEHAQLLEIATTAEVHTDIKLNSFVTAPFKIDTLGDAYVVAVMLENPSEAQKALIILRMLVLASAVTKKVMEYSNTGPLGLEPGSLKLRMGLCVGPAVSGLVGLMKPRYHLVGEAIRLATELESKSRAFHVRVDEATCSSFGWLKGDPMVDVSNSNWYTHYVDAEGSLEADGLVPCGGDVAVLGGLVESRAF